MADIGRLAVAGTPFGTASLQQRTSRPVAVPAPLLPACPRTHVNPNGPILALPAVAAESAAHWSHLAGWLSFGIYCIGRFDWDPQKALSNFAKHGVSFESAITAFDDPCGLVAVDDKHSTRGETREWLIGESDGGLLVVVFTKRDEAGPGA